MTTGSVALAPARGRGDAAVPTWREALGTSGLVQVAVLVALFSLLYWDHFVRLFHLWKNPDWSHGFAIPLFSLYFIHTKRKELLSGERRGSLWGLALMLWSFAVYVMAIRMQIGYPQPLSIISMIAGAVLLMCGWRTLWLTLFPIGFLALAIPPPDRLYKAFTQPLQQAAAAIATVVLNSFPGAEVERGGINIAFWMRDGHAGSFTVAGACSGMRSLLAFVAIGLATAYFTPRPAWQRLAMAVVVVPVALFCNILRVIITGAFQMYRLGDLASGTPHMVLGLLMFGLGFSMYLGLLYVLDHLYVDQATDDEGGEDGMAPRRQSRALAGPPRPAGQPSGAAAGTEAQ